MSKTCLNRLQGNILVNCTVPAHGISDLYLIHVEDVTLTYSSDATQISSITFAEGTKSYRVEGYKQNLQVTAALRSTDASARFDVSVMFKANLAGVYAQSITGGKFYVMLVEPGGSGLNTVWGCVSPLECSNVEYDSNANGKMVTYTLSAPDGSAGNIRVATSAAVASTIISKSV